MKNNIYISFALLILASFGCKTNRSATSKLGSTNFVDAQSAKNEKPFLVGDSLTKAKENWQLVFSDEFN